MNIIFGVYIIVSVAIVAYLAHTNKQYHIKAAKMEDEKNARIKFLEDDNNRLEMLLKEEQRKGISDKMKEGLNKVINKLPQSLRRKLA